MSKKRGRDRTHMIGGLPGSDTNKRNDLIEMDAAIYGGNVPDIDGDRRVADPQSIDDITPDPRQPRRSLPSDVRSEWDGNPENAFVHWSELAAADLELEQEYVFEAVSDMLIGTSDSAQIIGAEGRPLSASWFELVSLAASIRADGLTNPISVAADGPNFIIETGERRWLAYHLLRWWARENKPDEVDQWSRIPAYMVDGLDVWRQASENNARTDLNAIARARQLALLLMDLYGMENFRAFDSFKHEQHFYAQVADGNQWPIPPGNSDRVAAGIGVSSGAQTRQYRRLLRLPTKAWRMADDFNLTEYRLRQIITTAEMNDRGGDSEYIAALVYEAAMEFGAFGAEDTAHRKPGLTIDNSQKPKKDVRDKSLGSRAYFSEMVRLIKRTGSGKEQANEKALNRLQEVEQWVKAEIERIQAYES